MSTERLTLRDRVDKDTMAVLDALFDLPDDYDPDSEEHELLSTVPRDIPHSMQSAWLYSGSLEDGERKMDSRGKAQKEVRQAFPLDKEEGAKDDKLDFGDEGKLNLGYNIPFINPDFLKDEDWDGTLSPDWESYNSWRDIVSLSYKKIGRLHKYDEAIEVTCYDSRGDEKTVIYRDCLGYTKEILGGSLFYLVKEDDLREVGENKLSGDMASGIITSAARKEGRLLHLLGVWAGIFDGKEWIPRHTWSDDEYFDALMDFEGGEENHSARYIFNLIAHNAGTANISDILDAIGEETDWDFHTKHRIWNRDTKQADFVTEWQWIDHLIHELAEIRIDANDTAARLDAGDPLVDNTIVTNPSKPELDLQVQAAVPHTIYLPDRWQCHDWHDKIPAWHGRLYPSYIAWSRNKEAEAFVARMAGMLDRVSWRKPGEVIRARCQQILHTARTHRIPRWEQHMVIQAVADRCKFRPGFGPERPMHLLSYLLDKPRYREDKLLNSWEPNYKGYVTISSARVRNPKKATRSDTPVSYYRMNWVQQNVPSGCYFWEEELIECRGSTHNINGCTSMHRPPSLPHSAHTRLNAGWVHKQLMLPRVKKAMRGMGFSLQYKPIGEHGPRHSGGVALGVEWYLRAYTPSDNASGNLASAAWQRYAKQLITKLVGHAQKLEAKRNSQWDAADEYVSQLRIAGKNRGL